MPPVLHVPTFGGGVVLNASADTKRTDELEACDGYDIIARGTLVPADPLEAYAKPETRTVIKEDWANIYGIAVVGWQGNDELLIVGEGDDATDGPQFYLSRAAVVGELATIPTAKLSGGLLGSFAGGTPLGPGGLVTFAAMSFVDGADQIRPVFINIGPRVGQLAATVPGLYVLRYTPSSGLYLLTSIQDHNSALGDGTSSKQIVPRGIVHYNGFIFMWGHDESASDKDGPNRAMFTNLGNPFKIGNDNQGAAANRLFEDTDAVLVGSGGETILAGLVWRGRLWFGTDRGLHWIAGYGRESFVTDGANQETNEQHVIGPHAMIEGPDGALYGCGTEGLWRFDGQRFEAIGEKLRDRDGRSIGWWDLLWRDTGAPVAAFPNNSNMDLVWMVADIRRGQVWVVIPFCDSTAGTGSGSDSVVIKYHVATGGFTKQTFLGTPLTHGAILRRGSADRQETYAVATESVVGPSTTPPSIWRYGHRTSAGEILPPPHAGEIVTFGPYAPFGPDGVGIMRKLYLTTSFDASELPVQFFITVAVDGKELAVESLTIDAVEPAAIFADHLWLDTTSGSLYRRIGGAWEFVPGGDDADGGRVTVPIAFTPTRGSRVSVTVAPMNNCGRHAIEGLAIAPAIVRSDK